MPEDTPQVTPGAQRIIDAAERVFYRHGLHGVGVEAVAAEAGVTKRTLYDRFGSKDAVIVAYLRQRDRRWQERFEERLTAAPAPRLDALFDAYLEDVPDPSRGCAFLNAAAELPRDHPAMEVVRAHKATVRHWAMTLAAEAAPHLDAELLGPQIVLLLEGAIVTHGIDPAGNWMGAARTAAHTLLGLAPEPAGTAPR